MIISIASGKGGTGKTTVAVNLALSLKNIQLLDCDVEEPNAHLFLKPRIKDIVNAFIPVPEVDEAKCAYCGKCREVCAYHAIAVLPENNGKKGSVLIFPHLCHGCGACNLLCPQGAIKEVNKDIGVVEIGEKDTMQFVHGRLNIGEAMSPPLIRQVKNYINPTRIVIIDAPPGTSCPVITAVKGSDFCVLVTEPTPFGLHDLKITVQVLEEMGIPLGVVVNRADIGDKKVYEYCKEKAIPILLEIPFQRKIAELYSRGIPFSIEMPEWKEKFQTFFNEVRKLVGK